MDPHATRNALRQKLIKRFDTSQLEGLCYALGVDHELLDQRNKDTLARSLISHLQHLDRLPDLIARCRQLRPGESWPDAKDLTTETPPPATPLPAASPFFVGGRINDPRYFFGRERQLREIRADLRKFSSVSLYGPPQVGKSSLLYYLYATRADWLPAEVTLAHIDLQSVLDEEDFCETVLFKLGGTGHNLRALKRALYRRDVILLFDEVERIAEPDFNPRLHDLLRALAQEPHFAMCLVTQRPLLDVFPPQTPGGVSPFHNIFTGRELGPFSDAEARAFLQASGANFTPAEIEQLLTESGRQPARLQRLARQLYRQKHG